MFWADKISDDIKAKLAAKISRGETLVVRDEKTASGRVHIGSMRGVAIHGLVADTLAAAGIPATFLYEINDFDPMDDVPPWLGDDWKQYLGLPLYAVPSPDGTAANFAEYFAQEFIDVITKAGFTPTYYRASELYKSGRMNDCIRIALEHAADIRRIYKDVSGSQKDEKWLPIAMVCESCGKVGTTKATAFDGERVTYTCYAGAGGAEGCKHTGTSSPFDGKAKLPWKPEWAAKWKVVGVDIEGAGKDHSTKGGARDVANHIAKEVFGIESPFDIPYEFFLDKDSKKMSSSKGLGATSKDISDLLPAPIFRLALLGRDPVTALSVDPNGDAVPFLWDWHDKIAEKFWSGVDDDDARLFSVLYAGRPPERMYLPRFSSVAFIVQMPHIDLVSGIEQIKESPLTEAEKSVLLERAAYTKIWVEKYASEKYRFTLQTELPDIAKFLTKEQKDAMKTIYDFIVAKPDVSGEDLHHELHRIKEGMGVSPKELFGALYKLFLGRESGPQAGWFLATLDRTFVLERLQETLT